MGHLAAVAVIAGLSAAGCATAGPVGLDELKPGDAIRITVRSGDRPAEWILVRQVSGSLEVRAESNQPSVRMEVVGMDRLQVVRGRAMPQGGLIGAFAGGLGGILAGMVCRARCAGNSNDRRYYAPLTGFAIGATVGAVAGILLAPARWLNVRLR